jgi:hypothetical protein
MPVRSLDAHRPVGARRIEGHVIRRIFTLAPFFVFCGF